MHRPTILTVLTLFLRSSTAFVSFAHSLHPEIDTSTISLSSLDLANTPSATFSTIQPSPASPSLSDPSPTELQPSLATSDSESPSPSRSHDLKARQAAITAPPAALPANPLQIPPVTTYEIDSYPPGGGAAVRVPIVYTQKFDEVPDQWELPGVGSIGMGGIQGEVGVVKTKRFVPFFVDGGDEGVARTASSFTA